MVNPFPLVTDWFSGLSGQGACANSGLLRSDATAKEIPVPLRRRDVSATVYAAASFSDTKETLSYVSDVECSAVFRFPLPPRAAVYRCVRADAVRCSRCCNNSLGPRGPQPCRYHDPTT